MLYALIASIIANIAIPIALTYFHMKEKKDLHDRLMAKSPDSYIYDTQVAPYEVEALKREFEPQKLEKPGDPADERRREHVQGRY